MTDVPADLDEALEQVIAAARDHLAAVKAADGAIDDENVWRSFVSLNNASYEYDQLLLDSYGEVTPWDTETIEVSPDARMLTEPGVSIGETRTDPYPSVISVRQRRDYRVPSVAALLVAGEVAARRTAPGDQVTAPRTVTEAVLELVRDGDGSLSGLDVPELEPQIGLLTIAEVPQPLRQQAPPAEAFRFGPDDEVTARLDEQPYLLDEELDPDSDEANDANDADDDR